MCLAIPGQVVELLDEERHYATVDVSGVRRKVNIGLLTEEGLNVGDWVLIHVGFAMSKISEQAAMEQLQLLSLLGETESALEEVSGYRFPEEEASHATRASSPADGREG
jgi:hydrogenase expression/formation protein HypC